MVEPTASMRPSITVSPTVGISLFEGQPDNNLYMKAKGAAVGLNLNIMSSTDLLNALRTLINDPSLVQLFFYFY